ncbi:hypothetical protein [Azospirillum argentinense]|uniref:hypothetical protein n=1 Tax=Azospirillum argentinense TaxID=2970906 RepID=UPI0032DF9711
MHKILKDSYFGEQYSGGFLETGIALPSELVGRIRDHYAQKAHGHNDFPKFFVNNEHQSYLESWALGTFMTAFPRTAKKMVKNFYGKAYTKAVYSEQVFIEEIMKHLLANGIRKLFKTRYLVVGYDMYLRNTHKAPPAGIHSDMPNFHHFYETENDISFYIPLVDLNEANGGRLSVLPEDKLKVPGSILLKALYDHFSRIPACVDDRGYVDPDKVSDEALAAFIKSRPYQELMSTYKSLTGLAKSCYAKDFRPTEESAGRVLFFNNKNFHAAEQWRNPDYDREVYVIRTFPIYDVKIKLRGTLHGVPVNKFLVDMEAGEIRRYDREVDIASIPDDQKVAL